MKYKEFLQYPEENLSGYETFIRKATAYQEEKNHKRPAKKCWNDEKVQAAAYDMWKASMQTLYDNLNREIGSGSEFAWRDYIEKNNVLESVNDGISELSFDDQGC